MKKARLIYLPEENKREEQYKVEILTEKGWELETAFFLVERAGLPGRKDFVHYSVLTTLHYLQDLGYEIYILPKVED